MPAGMEGWRSAGVLSKEEQESGGTAASGAFTGGAGGAGGAGGNKLTVTTVVAAGSKRQRWPSVRLGEIGDLKVAVSKNESFSTAKWISPSFILRKSPSGVPRGPGKLPRRRAIANVTDRDEIGQVLGSPEVGTNGVAPAAAIAGGTAEDDVQKDEEGPEANDAPASTSGRGSYGTTTTSARYGSNRRAKLRKRKRGPSIRSSTIAKTIGEVTLNRKAKEFQRVEYIGNLVPAPAIPMPIDLAELSGTQADMEEDSGAERRSPGNDQMKNHGDDEESSEEEEHTQNGETEVLEGENCNDEDYAGRPEEDEPGTGLGVRDKQTINTNGALGAPHDFFLRKDDHRDQCTSRLTDSEKDRKSTLPIREASLNGRRGDARGGVRSWLISLGLDKYSELFEENEVDNDVLQLLTFEDLKEMGVVAVGARRKMFAAIQELGPAISLGR